VFSHTYFTNQKQSGFIVSHKAKHSAEDHLPAPAKSGAASYNAHDKKERNAKKLERSWFLPSRKWQNRLAAIFLLGAIISGILTYAAMTETPPLGNDPNTVIWLLNIDFVFLLLLTVLISRRIVGVWSGRRRGIAGSDLHVRLVYTFSLLAAVPAVIMTVFSAFFFHFGVQTWFSERVSTAVNESQVVAEAYLEEHMQVIRADALAMANDLDRQATFLMGNEKAFETIVETQSVLRNLSEAIVIDSSGRVLARSGLTFSLEMEELPQYAMRQAEQGDVAIMTGGDDDRVRAFVKLNNFIDTYLYVGRMVDPQVLAHLDATRQASQDYEDLQARYSGLQITVILIFVIVGLLLMLAAVWLGLLLARQMVTPITDLITTADRVRAGDLSARVADQKDIEEFDYLAKSFNRMTKQIQEQQGELINANRQLDRRRRLTETVLAGVSSGVIGVDSEGLINLANTSAQNLLNAEEGQGLEGKNIRAVMPEIHDLLDEAHKRPQKITQKEIPVSRSDHNKRTFLVRIVIELVGDKDVGAILTFDDITELQSAQRKAAWADVARRIAHEIKNPLTPIQLSAERLRRKYLGQITEDAETFSQCTDTIIRHVGDIGRMVNEFSSFARMPEPVVKPENLAMHVRETLVLHQQAHPHIAFTLKGCERGERIPAQFDSQQIRQALNNLLQNAVDSIDARLEKDQQNAVKKPAKGSVDILVQGVDDEYVSVIVNDNGIGLPKDADASSLSEPYVTHKPKGTGLGLAIVKKIMEDHSGKLVLGSESWMEKLENWRSLEGASVALLLPAGMVEENNAQDNRKSVNRKSA